MVCGPESMAGEATIIYLIALEMACRVLLQGKRER